MIIMPHPYGRMCNRLVLASTFIAHAEDTGDSFVYLGFLEYARFFEGSRRFPVLFYRASSRAEARYAHLVGCVNIWNTYDRRGEPYLLNSAEFLARQHDTRLLIVIGWLFRSSEAVRRHKALIRHIFKPVARHKESVDRLADQLRRGADHVVGVHIRLTDYKTFAGGKFFFPLETYSRVMRDIAGQLAGRTRFLVCSDAPVEPAAFGGLDVTGGTGHPVEDNYALATCDYLVGPPSTYNIWSSFYGGVPRCALASADQTVRLADFEVTDTI